jgi:hypothetical protein
MSDAFVQREGGLWTRREMVSAMGAGIMVTACAKTQDRSAPADSAPASAVGISAQSPDDLKIRFYGASLYMVLPRNADPNTRLVRVLMPRTQSARGFHPDTTCAVQHSPYLAIYSKHGSGADYLRSYELQGLEGLTLTGADSREDPNVGALPDMKKILKGSAQLRPDSGSGAFQLTTGIKVVGGTWSPLVVNNRTRWRVAKSFNSSAPELTPLVPGLEWSAGRTYADLGGTATGLPGRISTSDSPAVVIGHLPTSHPPAHWYDKLPPNQRGDADIDFKWLYTLFMPRAGANGNNPWLDELELDILLPAPRCVEGSSSDLLEESTVDSPTCFGGCWGC